MTNLQHAARMVIDRWSSGDLAGAVNALEEALEVEQAAPVPPIRVLIFNDGGIVQQVVSNRADLDIVLHDTDKHAEPADRVHVSHQVLHLWTDAQIDAAIAEDTRPPCNGDDCDTLVDPGDAYFATPCGTFCDDCMPKHAAECAVCAQQFNLAGATS